MSGWHPVAASADLAPGHVYQTMLEGLGLAAWRAPDGTVNLWEDRCPHRGLRFSMGAVIGGELRCQYHGWRFASGDGRCTHVPAHPQKNPPGAARVTILPAVEQDGLIWTTLTRRDAPPPRTPGAVLRAIPVDRGAAEVASALDGPTLVGAQLFVQPVAPDRCVVRGVAPRARLRAIDNALETLRTALETA